MDFAFTPEQELLRETARGLLARSCPPSLLRAHIEDLDAAAPLWAELAGFAELGTGPVVDLCVFMEELGYVAAPGQFLASAVLAAPVLALVGGPVQTATLAVAGADGAWRLNDEPRKSFVLDAATFLLQWATGGLLFLWVTTRRREVGLGYGWLLRATFGVLAVLGLVAGLGDDGAGASVRNVGAVVMAAATGLALMSCSTRPCSMIA